MTAPHARSHDLLQRSTKLFPGGVSSPVRAYRAVGGEPPFIAFSAGATVTDVDGNRYVDYVGSWGPLILGHAHPAVVEAVSQAAARGTSYGAPSESEVVLGELIREAVPSMERMRFVSSGTEATMSALRLARGFTGRDRVLKFDGGYHGHSDALLVAAGSGLLTSGVASSAGVPASWAASTISVPYNDLGAVERAFERYPDEIAAIIVEPVAGNMGVVPPVEGFLTGLRELASRHGALLIFDEVITGFRVAPGGAQERFGILPDLTCLGKIVGGGLPVGVYGGRGDVMALIAPEGPVYQAGTLSGNPVAMAAGAATLEQLREPGGYQRLEEMAADVQAALNSAAARHEVPLRVQRVGSMFTPFFVDSPVTDETSAKRSDTSRYARFFHGLLDQGIYPPPSQFEAWFVSLAHGPHELAHTIQSVEVAMASTAAGPA